MSENNQNNRAASENGKKENRNGKWRKNRHRPYRGNRASEPAKPPETVTEQAHTTATAEEIKAEQPQQSRNNRPYKGRGGKDHKNDRKAFSEGNKNGRHPIEKRPYDPYETPSKEEIALSELRAQIVLQAADGTTPTPYSALAGAIPASSDITEESTEPAMSPAPDEPTPLTEETEKVEVVGVRFRSAGKMYYFDPHGIKAKKGNFSIVETTRGPEFGEICLENTMIGAGSIVAPLRPLVRIATPADIAHNEENRQREKEALTICQQKIQDHGLEMKLIDVQYAFDNSKLLFYFSAEGRVDFRELVKDLASVFRTRIELRQIGIRDEAKMLGGIGACGRTLCCSTFLPDFAQVSIKMAKEQNLSLNSNKISGVCGRLMCCLRYESEVYAEEIRKTPANDSTVRTEDGIGTVISSNPLAGTVRVVLKDSPDVAPKQYHRDDVTVLPKERKGALDRRETDEKMAEN